MAHDEFSQAKNRDCHSVVVQYFTPSSHDYIIPVF